MEALRVRGRGVDLGYVTVGVRMNPKTIDELVDRLRSRDEDAFHALIEAPESVLPHLLARFRTEADPDLRERIVEVVWQHRHPSSVAFLGEALHDPSDGVWKQALDGLVTIGGESAASLLRSALGACGPREPRREWLAEALEQLRDV